MLKGVYVNYVSQVFFIHVLTIEVKHSGYSNNTYKYITHSQHIMSFEMAILHGNIQMF